MRLYLAGPDVFLPDPHQRAARLKALCAEFGLIAISPLDEFEAEPAHWANLPEAHRIGRRCEAHIASCDVLVANLTPFRGPSADVGTVFEMGVMRALGRPVYGWSNDVRSFAERTRAFCATTGNTDHHGMQIEDFDLADNLMLESAILASGGQFSRHDCPAAERWTDLTAFQACLATLVVARHPA